MKALCKASNIKLELAEPRNHRSIGKVERLIGFLQKVLNQYNLILGNKLTQQDRFEDAWRTIECLLPFIQLSFNQRRPRFTTFSPNMLMFGSNLDDASDVDRILHNIQQIRDNEKSKLTLTDFEYLRTLMEQIQVANQTYRNDWQKYTYLSAQSYSTRFNINKSKQRRYARTFTVGKQVLYFVGDKAVANQKWKRRWTGPWLIDQRLNDSTVIIADPESGNQKRVSIDRLKLFKNHNDQHYTKLYNNDMNYVTYRKPLLDKLKGYNVDFREKDFELDYTQNQNENAK